MPHQFRVVLKGRELTPREHNVDSIGISGLTCAFMNTNVGINWLDSTSCGLTADYNLGNGTGRSALIGLETDPLGRTQRGLIGIASSAEVISSARHTWPREPQTCTCDPLSPTPRCTRRAALCRMML
jgi:hypothetical protein